MNVTSSRYAGWLSELDDLYLSIQKISGFTVEQLLNMFMAGYEMSPPKYGTIPQLMPEDIKVDKKEGTTMQVTYNGLTGELVKLERKDAVMTFNPLECRGATKMTVYDLTLYDSEKQAAISFTGVKLEDVKFLGGVVTFG